MHTTNTFILATSQIQPIGLTLELDQIVGAGQVLSMWVFTYSRESIAWKRLPKNVVDYSRLLVSYKDWTCILNKVIYMDMNAIKIDGLFRQKLPSYKLQLRLDS